MTWQTIETAPEAKGKYFFCRVAWGPSWDKKTSDGFRWEDKWFASGLFLRPAASASDCHYEYRTIEVQPTHWMNDPEGPEVSHDL